jgi:general secretion pathway protein G
MNAPARRRREGGFSLVELLVVITIIGILATTVTLKVIGALAQARVTKAKAEIAKMKEAVNMFSIVNNGKMPETLEALAEPQKGYPEGFIDIAKDPWGNDYEYERTGRKVIIRSWGADGAPGGEDEDADIDSDHLRDEGDGTGGAVK